MRTLAYACGCAILVVISSSAQEISRKTFSPSQLNRSVPDRVVYLLLMHQAIAFHRDPDGAAKHNLEGTSRSALFLHRYGLRPEQVNSLERIASGYRQEVAPYERQMVSIITEFQNRYFPGGKLVARRPVPPPPPELQRLSRLRDAAVRSARDHLRAIFGENDFRRLDSAIKRGFNIKSTRASSRGTSAWACTSVDFDPSTFALTAYSETDEDPDLAAFYRPSVQMHIQGQDGLTVAETRANSGLLYASADLLAPGRPGATYTAFSSHHLVLNAQYFACPQDKGCGYYYNDYYNEGRYASLDILEPGLFEFYGPGPMGPESDSDLTLGGTYDSVTITPAPSPRRLPGSR